VAKDLFVPQERILPLPAVLEGRSASVANAGSPIYRAPLLPVVTACAPVIATALETRERAAWGDRVRGLRRSVLRQAGPGS